MRTSPKDQQQQQNQQLVQSPLSFVPIPAARTSVVPLVSNPLILCSQYDHQLGKAILHVCCSRNYPRNDPCNRHGEPFLAIHELCSRLHPLPQPHKGGFKGHDCAPETSFQSSSCEQKGSTWNTCTLCLPPFSIITKTPTHLFPPELCLVYWNKFENDLGDHQLNRLNFASKARFLCGNILKLPRPQARHKMAPSFSNQPKAPTHFFPLKRCLLFPRFNDCSFSPSNLISYFQQEAKIKRNLLLTASALSVVADLPPRSATTTKAVESIDDLLLRLPLTNFPTTIVSLPPPSTPSTVAYYDVDPLLCLIPTNHTFVDNLCVDFLPF
jgi:hypothetical protein